MSEMMMTSVYELSQPYHEAAKHEGNMFPDMLHCYDFTSETEIEIDHFNSPKLIDNQEEFQSNSDHVLFDLNVSDLQFSDLLLVPGVNTYDGSATKSLHVTPENCQNLEEDIFKTYACLADAVSPSSDEQDLRSALSSSCEIYQSPPTLTESQSLIDFSDAFHNRFKTRSLSVDSVFANYQEETSRLLNSSLSAMSPHSDYTELRRMEATSVVDTNATSNSRSQFQQQSFPDENSIALSNECVHENEFHSHEFLACSPSAEAKTLEETSTMDSFLDSIYELQFPSQPPQSVNESTANCPEVSQSLNGYTVNSTEVVTSNSNATDPPEELPECVVSRSPEPMLPTTLDSISSETSAEVSFESLPESLLHLDSVPKASCAPSKPPSRRKRGRKLWEFLMDLLEDPVCNPSLIRWEDKPKGIFRLKEQEVIARKWGKRRGKKDNLSYDYFARALRYHYKSKMLVSVPERKLVYKFGPKVLSQMK